MTIGLAALYGTAVASEAGAGRMLDILRQAMTTALGLLGCARLTDLDRTYLNC